MPTRRSFLAASATGALAAAAGCADALPLVGSTSSGQPSSGRELVESFLAEPSLASSFDAVREPHSTVSTIRYYDNSLSEHADDLAVDEDLSWYGRHVLGLRKEDSAVIESVDQSIEVGYETGWRHDDPEGSLSQSGMVRGGLGYLRGEYDRDAYADLRGFTGSPSFSADGYDVYGVGEPTRTMGFADDGILQGLAYPPYVPGEDVDDATADELEAALLERGTKRSTSTQSPQGWIQDVVDAIGPAHHLWGKTRTTSTGDSQDALASGFHVDGGETTVVLAQAAPDASTFEEEFETSEEVMELSVVRTISHLVQNTIPEANSRQERHNAVEEMLLEGPTIDLDDSQGVVSAVVPSDAVAELVL